MSKKVLTTIAAGFVLAACFVICAVSDASAAEGSVEGYLYGTVETKDGATHTGVLRWDDEEAFWDDIFHSSKKELPFEDYAEDAEADDEATWWKRMAVTIAGDLELDHQSRVVAVRFGDLRKVRVTGRNDAVLTLRDGTEIEVGGYANDVTATVTVIDEKPGRVEIPWKRIDVVAFSETPTDAEPGTFRLHGTVSTTEGEFVGFIQWDNQECLSTDRLDGDTADDDVSIEMGDIRSIEKRDRRSSIVVLKDGAEMVLSGTNDVNHDIRGIHVEDARFGRVEVGWREFDKVVFDDPGSSGAAYGEYSPPVRLSGTVTLANGDWRSGRLIYDLDEEWNWEMLDGSSDSIDYTVPFGMVASIELKDRGRCLVRLRNGQQLELEDSQDVGRDNAGLVVVPRSSGEPAHVAWSQIAEIEFD
jgi:hypothetical protein